MKRLLEALDSALLALVFLSLFIGTIGIFVAYQTGDAVLLQDLGLHFCWIMAAIGVLALNRWLQQPIDEDKP